MSAVHDVRDPSRERSQHTRRRSAVCASCVHPSTFLRLILYVFFTSTSVRRSGLVSRVGRGGWGRRDDEYTSHENLKTFGLYTAARRVTRRTRIYIPQNFLLRASVIAVSSFVRPAPLTRNGAARPSAARTPLATQTGTSTRPPRQVGLGIPTGHSPHLGK